MVLDTGNILLVGSILLFVSVVVCKAGFRLGVPALLLFLMVGMLFGSNGVGIQFNNPSTAQFIGTIALSVILFSGGLDTKYQEIKPIWGPGVVLATVGVILMTIFTGLFIYYLASIFGNHLQLSLMESMLLAAVMSSTDSASVFSILRSRKQGLKYELRPLLELESGSNDPMAYMLTILLIGTISATGLNSWSFVLNFLMQMGIGLVAGYLLGRFVAFIINNINIDNRSLYSVLLLSSAFFIFAIADLIKGNGFLAVYIGGLVVGNHRLKYKKILVTFFDGFAWLFQIVMFLTLGLLVNPIELINIIGVASLIAVVMIFAARPLTVLLCMAPFKGFTYKAKAYISWVGLRGAVPIIFATYPLLAGLEHSNSFFNIVFFITIISLIVQGTTVGIMAEWLGLSENARQSNFNIELLDNVKSSLSEIDVVDELLDTSNNLRDLTLPEHTLVVLIRRGDNFFVPEADTLLLAGDKLLVISDNDEELHKTFLDMGIIIPIGR